MFNALKYIKNLEAAGFPREQAEAQVQLVIAAFEDEVASKSDLSELHNEMKSEFAQVRSEFRQEFAQVRSEFAQFRSDVNQEFAKLRSEINQEFARVRSESAQFRSEVNQEFAKLRSEISEMKSDLVFKLGALFVGSNTVGFGMLGILFAFMNHRP